MKLIKHFQELAFDKLLNHDYARIHREPRQINVEEIETVGLLYHCSDEETYQQINAFVSELKGKKQKISVIGYYKGIILPQYYAPKPEWDLITLKNVNWFNKPEASFVKAFCDQEFDLLIDLTMEDILPVIYAGALSRAHFKAGRYSERNAKYYDLMIHTEHVQTLPEFIKHVKHYISKVNC